MRSVFEQYRDGEATWVEVVSAVRAHRFVARPANSHADYVRIPGSFEDEVTVWLMRRVITRDQWRELRAIWKTSSMPDLEE